MLGERDALGGCYPFSSSARGDGTLDRFTPLLELPNGFFHGAILRFFVPFYFISLLWPVPSSRDVVHCLRRGRRPHNCGVSDIIKFRIKGQSCARGIKHVAFRGAGSFPKDWPHICLREVADKPFWRFFLHTVSLPLVWGRINHPPGPKNQRERRFAPSSQSFQRGGVKLSVREGESRRIPIVWLGARFKQATSGTHTVPTRTKRTQDAASSIAHTIVPARTSSSGGGTVPNARSGVGPDAVVPTIFGLGFLSGKQAMML